MRVGWGVAEGKRMEEEREDGEGRSNEGRGGM